MNIVISMILVFSIIGGTTFAMIADGIKGYITMKTLERQLESLR